jgi:sugar transferase (PEP-CTERM/EpsH1 system associated)
MTQIHVLHIVPSLEVGGLENGLVNVVARADPRAVRHTIVCLEEKGTFASRLPAATGVHVLGKRSGLDARALVRLAALARRLAPDVVHSRNWATLIEGWVAARAAGARHVHGLHGRTANDLAGEPFKRRLIERAILRRVDRMVVLLERLRSEAHARGARPERTVVVENGVDLLRFRPDPEARTLERAELGATPRDLVVGCVARLDPVKDHGTLLRAFARLAGADRRALLVLVGAGPMRRALEALARVDGIAARVRFLGPRDDVERIYPAFDVFALASRYEGSSNTLLEAMACGLPIVATNAGGTPDLVPPEAGRLVEVGDADGLGQALVALARDAGARDTASQAARAAAEQRSIDRMARAYLALWREVTGSEVAAIDVPPRVAVGGPAA